MIQQLANIPKALLLQLVRPQQTKMHLNQFSGGRVLGRYGKQCVAWLNVCWYRETTFMHCKSQAHHVMLQKFHSMHVTSNTLNKFCEYKGRMGLLMDLSLPNMVIYFEGIRSIG